MRSIDTQIEIGAPAHRVWEVLTDFEGYPDWNPFVRSLRGRFEVGESLEVRLEPPGSRGMTFKPRVTAFEDGRELRWLGHLLVPGLFDGEHQFRVEPVDAHRSLLVQREDFKGLLSGLMLRLIGDRTRGGFEAMNQAIKERAEAGT